MKYLAGLNPGIELARLIFQGKLAQQLLPDRMGIHNRALEPRRLDRRQRRRQQIIGRIKRCAFLLHAAKLRRCLTFLVCIRSVWSNRTRVRFLLFHK